MKAVVVALALVVCAPTVHASPGDAMQEAKDHYDRGMSHYELGEFAGAVDEFKAAYSLSQAPGLLFNLAQASRLGKDYEQALHFYRTYLRVRPDAANRDDVEKRISELEPIVEKRRRAEAERLPPPPVAPPPVARAADDKPVVVTLRPSGRGAKVAGLVVGIAGLGLVGAGIGLGVASLDAQNKLSSLATQMGSWSAEQSKLYNTGKTDAAVSTALYVVGGVAAATGVILYAVGVKRDRARFAVAPLPGGGAHAVVACDF